MDFEGFWQRVSVREVIRPSRLWSNIALALVVLCAIAISCLLGRAGLEPWPWVIMLAGVASLLLIRTLLIEPRAAFIPFADALLIALGLGLVPLALAFGPDETRRWTILAVGVSILSAPALGKLWNAQLLSVQIVRGVRALRQDVEAALTGEIDALLLHVVDQRETWVGANAEGRERQLQVEMAALTSASGGEELGGVELEGTALLLHKPTLQRAGSAEQGGGPLRVTSASRVDFLGESESVADPAPFLAEGRAGLTALALIHGAAALAVVAGFFLLG